MLLKKVKQLANNTRTLKLSNLNYGKRYSKRLLLQLFCKALDISILQPLNLFTHSV